MGKEKAIRTIRERSMPEPRPIPIIWQGDPALEYFSSLVNRRTARGKEMWSALEDLAERDQKTLGLIKSISLLFPGQPLEDILNARLINFQRDTPGTCVCGEALTKQVYVMEVHGHLKRDDPETHVTTTIRAGKHPTRRLIQFQLGETHFKNSWDLLKQ